MYCFAVHMTGLLHEGIFHVEGLCKIVTFGSLHRAYITSNTNMENVLMQQPSHISACK